MTPEEMKIQDLSRKLDLALHDISKRCSNCLYEESCMDMSKSKNTDSMVRYITCDSNKSNWVWKYSK